MFSISQFAIGYYEKLYILWLNYKKNDDVLTFLNHDKGLEQYNIEPKKIISRPGNIKALRKTLK